MSVCLIIMSTCGIIMSKYNIYIYTDMQGKCKQITIRIFYDKKCRQHMAYNIQDAIYLWHTTFLCRRLPRYTRVVPNLRKQSIKLKICLLQFNLLCFVLWHFVKQYLPKQKRACFIYFFPGIKIYSKLRQKFPVFTSLLYYKQRGRVEFLHKTIKRNIF